MSRCIRLAVLALLATALVPTCAQAATHALSPFPSNLLTVPDATQRTGIRVDLPRPDCATNPSDCADVALLNQLDGFNVQPRISIPFSGPIDTSTVSSSSVFLVGPGDHVVGVNQAVWEPLTNTLHVESDELLRQSSTYLLVITTGIRDAGGEPLDATKFRHDLNYGQEHDPAVKAYRKALLDALPSALAGGANPSEIAGASLFTTQSVTAISQKIRAQLRASAAPSATFALGPAGTRTVFPLATTTSVQWARQIGTAVFSPTSLALAALPGVGNLAFGSYDSPDYETAAKVIPAVGTATGVPAVQGVNQVQFTLFEPAGVAPAGGWPTVVFGHGFGDSKNGAPVAVAGTLARSGLATIAINVVGHGFGPLGTYTVSSTSGPPVTFPAGGRAVDQNASGTFDSTEGVNAVGPDSLVGNRDGLRQTVIDLMQLVRVLESGVDVDGDGAADLSTSRIYYAGQSFGGIYGIPLLSLEPDLRAGVANVPGGPIIEIARLSPAFRPLVGIALITRTPSLYNAVPNASLTSFVENIPLRNLPLVVDTVPGASAIQSLIDDTEWEQNAANPVAYAEHVTPPLIVQFARGDQTVPNPTASAILRAGHLEQRATLYRNDLAFAANPAVPKNPHAFLTNIGSASAGGFAFAAQNQIATFFTSDGATIVDPDGPLPFFETPTSIVPEDLAFIP